MSEASAPMEPSLVSQALMFLLIGVLSGWILLHQRRKARLPPGVEYPPHRHSWIPFLGRALEMTSRPVPEFIRDLAQGEPLFTCTVAGDKCLFLADPKLVPLIYKDRPELDFQHLADRFQVGVLGMSAADAHHQATVGPATSDLFQKHFLRREALGGNIHVAQGVLIRQVDSLMTTDDWKQMGLYQLTCSIVFKATVASVVGEYMTQDQFVQDFMAFDKDFPLLFSGLAPNWFTAKSRQARERLVQAMASEAYASTSQTPFIKERAARMSAHKDVPHEFNMRQQVALLWVSVANSMPSIFWTVYYLLKNPEAYLKCQEQVDAIVAKKPAENRFFFTLEELDQMSLLNSIFFETLRLKQVIYSARMVTADFVFNPKDQRKFMLEKGTRVLACPTLVHHDAEIFENPQEFQYDRFVDPDAMTKQGKPLSFYMRAFGGGGHLCSGRKFIAYESQSMLAMMLSQLDMRLLDRTAEVGMDYSRQGIGVPPPTTDPMMEVRRKVQ